MNHSLTLGKTAIVGMGITGKSLLKYFQNHFAPTDLATFDKNENFDHVGARPLHFIDSARLMSEFGPDTLVVSPGVPLHSPWIAEAKKNGVRLTSEINIAAQHLQNEIVVGITGSLGKSTTTSLLGEAAQAQDPHAFVGGNLGTPFIEYAQKVLTGSPRAHFIVLELSSFQLENAAELSLHSSAITYLSANHLERYRDLAEYYQVKGRVISQTKHKCVLNKKGGDLENYAQQLDPNTFIWAQESPLDLSEKELSERFLIGSHNLDNVKVACCLAKQVGISPAAQRKMLGFQGLPHRLERLPSVGGVEFINDSKATSLESIETAVAIVKEKSLDHKVFLLLGGRDKKLPWEKLRPLSGDSKLVPIFFGESAALVQQKTQLLGTKHAKLEEALLWLRDQAKSGDWVLLSPGGTSLDEFKNFEDRGNFFKEWVTREFR